MSIALVQSELPSPPRKRWTREECAHLESLGAWEGQKLELIEGELLDKMGKNWPHVAALFRILRWLSSVFGAEFVLQEAPVGVSLGDEPWNEPEPDAIVLREPVSRMTGKPTASDLVLVVEVADSSLRLDLGVKAGLYVRAGIVEYWVVDLNGRRLIVHREPVDGVYGSVVAFGEDERVSPLAATDARLVVGEALGG